MIKTISKEQTHRIIKNGEKQYLAGDLSRPQWLKHIESKDVNIAISSCKETTVTVPHYHTICTEYEFVLEGKVCLQDLTEGKEYTFEKGDFFVIYPGTEYTGINYPYSTMLVIKVPAADDKISLEKGE